MVTVFRRMYVSFFLFLHRRAFVGGYHGRAHNTPSEDISPPLMISSFYIILYYIKDISLVIRTLTLKLSKNCLLQNHSYMCVRCFDIQTMAIQRVSYPKGYLVQKIAKA